MKVPIIRLEMVVDGYTEYLREQLSTSGKAAEWIWCHSANYLEPFSSVYLDVLSGPNSVMVRLNGGYSA